MNTMRKCLAFIGILALACATIGGCSNYPAKAAPVEPAKAMSALTTALDAWQAGQKIESLASASPEIVVQDLDWMQGKKLAGYKIVGDGLSQDANLRVEVELSLGDASTAKRVAYIVGTDPKLTVFRSFD